MGSITKVFLDQKPVGEGVFLHSIGLYLTRQFLARRVQLWMPLPCAGPEKAVMHRYGIPIDHR